MKIYRNEIINGKEEELEIEKNNFEFFSDDDKDNKMPNSKKGANYTLLNLK